MEVCLYSSYVTLLYPYHNIMKSTILRTFFINDSFVTKNYKVSFQCRCVHFCAAFVIC